MFVGVLTILKVPLSSQGQTPYVPAFGVIVFFFIFLVNGFHYSPSLARHKIIFLKDRSGVVNSSGD